MSKGIPKNQVKNPNTILQSEHEDDADAKRVTLVNESGDSNSPAVPIFVKPTDFGSAAAAALVQLTFANLKGEDVDEFMINDNEEILFNDAGQLLRE